MDWGHDGRVVTLVAFDDGTTSLYFDQGGGILGMGENDAVRHAAHAFREEAVRTAGSFRAKSDFDLPRDGIITFYIVTDSGTAGSDRIEAGELELGRHALSQLGAKGRQTIAVVQSAFEAMKQGSVR